MPRISFPSSVASGGASSIAASRTTFPRDQEARIPGLPLHCTRSSSPGWRTVSAAGISILCSATGGDAGEVTRGSSQTTASARRSFAPARSAATSIVVSPGSSGTRPTNAPVG